MRTEPKYVAETLAWCNARREEWGKKPLKRLPKGIRQDSASCPCGKASGLFVHLSTFADSVEQWRVLKERPRLPRSVQRFVRAFDDGRLPQYEADVVAPPKAEA